MREVDRNRLSNAFEEILLGLIVELAGGNQEARYSNSLRLIDEASVCPVWVEDDDFRDVVELLWDFLLGEPLQKNIQKVWCYLDVEIILDDLQNFAFCDAYLIFDFFDRLIVRLNGRLIDPLHDLIVGSGYGFNLDVAVVPHFVSEQQTACSNLLFRSRRREQNISLMIQVKSTYRVDVPGRGASCRRLPSQGPAEADFSKAGPCVNRDPAKKAVLFRKGRCWKADGKAKQGS